MESARLYYVENNADVVALDPNSNPRFVGENPNNYLMFGNDLYRIIGVFNHQMKIIYWGTKENPGIFYGNATSSINTVCDNVSMYNWNSGEAKNYCSGTSYNWLVVNVFIHQWTITPSVLNDSSLFSFNNGGIYEIGTASNRYCARPVLFLKSDVKIVDGTGTILNPYKLSI